jgi:hypothetical protein
MSGIAHLMVEIYGCVKLGLTLCKLHIGFSRALHFENHMFKQQIVDNIYNEINEIIANAKPAPSSAPPLIWRLAVIHSFARDIG